MSKISERGLEKLVRQDAKVRRSELVRCPENSELISYHRRELPRKEAEAVREHLALCPRCIAELKQIIHFLAVAATAPAAPAAPNEKQWEKLLQALKQEGVEESVAPLSEPSKAEAWKTPGYSSFRLKEWVGRLLRPRVVFKPRFVFAILIVMMVSGAGIVGLLRLQRPDYWTNPHYANLVDLKSDLNALRNRGTRLPDNLKADAIQDLEDSSFSSARSKLLKHAKTDFNDEEGYRLLALTYLLTAKRTFFIDYEFDKSQVNQAIVYLQLANELAKNNVFAQEEILWLLGRAYAMLGDFETAAKQYQALLNMTDPSLVKKAEARQALDDLAALTTSLQPSPR